MHLLKSFNDRRKNKPAAPAVQQAPADNWDKPYSHPAGPSNKDLITSKDTRTAAKKEANNTPMAPVTFSKPDMGNDPHQYRLSTGDD